MTNCAECNKTIKQSNVKLAKCETCDKCFHAKCSQTGVTLREEDKFTVICCFSCMRTTYLTQAAKVNDLKLKITATIKENVGIKLANDAISKINSDLEEDVARLKHEVAEIRNKVKTEILDEVKQLIETNVKSTVKNEVLEDLKPLILKVPVASIDSDDPHIELNNENPKINNIELNEEKIIRIIQEDKEKEKRKMNICVKGVPNMGDDCIFIRDLCTSKLGLCNEEVKNIVATRRIGKGNDSSHRNLIATLNCPYTRRKILKNASKLKDLNDSFKYIYISRDLTPSEQLKNYELRNQLRNNKALKDNESQRSVSVANNIAPIATTACVH